MQFLSPPMKVTNGDFWAVTDRDELAGDIQRIETKDTVKTRQDGTPHCPEF